MFAFLKENALLVLAIASIAFLLLFGFYRVLSGAQGSWSGKLRAPPPTQPPARAGRDSEGETRARAFLERYFAAPFPKTRPRFLNNEVTQSNLEIDCFNEELRLGVEYNGRQHYEYVPFFHSSKEAFYNQKYRDKLKSIYCRERGITLIEIPYTELKHLEDWLGAELARRGFSSRARS